MSEEADPFWGYSGALLVGALFFAALLIGYFCAKLLVQVAGVAEDREIVTGIWGTAVGWGILAAMCAALFRMGYGRPLLTSLGFVRWSGSPHTAVLVGQALALAIAFLVNALGQARDSDNAHPFGLSTSSTAFWLVAFLGTTLFPFAEEAIFRGLLQPLTVRSFGPAIGIALPAVLYVLFTMPTFGWEWRRCIALTIASVTWGWIRHRTKSTTAAAVVHGAYNAAFWMWLILNPVFRSGAVQPK